MRSINESRQLVEKRNCFPCVTTILPIENTTSTIKLKAFTEPIKEKGFRSYNTLPIIKSGKTIGTFNLFSECVDLIQQDEILLLKEINNNISIVLEQADHTTAERKNKNELKRNELRFKNAQALAHLGCWEMDLSTQIAEWSEETCRIYGFSPEDNIHSQQEWLSFIHPEDKKYVLQTVRDNEETLTSNTFHCRIIRKDGRIRHILNHTQFEFNEEGKPVVIYGTAHDVTEVKETERALLQSEENLRQIIDLIPYSIFVKDYNGKYIFVNKSFASLYGQTPSELINKFIVDTIPEKSESEKFILQDREVIESGRAKTIPEQTFTDHTGTTRLFHTVKVAYTDAAKNEKMVLGISKDITKQKETETERSKMITEIVQRNKDLEKFSYIVSHNLRAPVANIIGLADVLLTCAMNNHDHHDFVRELGTCSNKLNDVVLDLNNILQVEHKENKKKELVNFSEVLNDVEGSFDTLIKSEGVRITGDFSEIDEMITIKNYLHSVFYNLISNSIKFRRSEVNPVIEISARHNNNKVQLIFKDNGMGIDLNKKSNQVFGLYKRFHTHVDGKGMGLFMVKTQVESLGGKISVASDVNCGTEFKIEFELY